MTRARLEDLQWWLFLGPFGRGSDVDIEEGDNQVGVGGIDLLGRS